jgi:hypothetical protein
MTVQFAPRRVPRSSMELSKRGVLPISTDTVLDIQPGRSDERITADRLINDERRTQINAQLDVFLTERSISLGEDQKGRVIAQLVRIHQTVSRIRDSYLDLGKCLLRISRESEALYEEITRKGTQILPFDYTVAIKCRRIAEAVETGRVSEGSLPATYTTAYEIATMDEPTLRLAHTRGLVRPDVTRAELVSLKRSSRVTTSPAPGEAPGILQARIKRIEERKAAFLAEAQARVADFDRQLEALRSRLRAIEDRAYIGSAA